MQPIAVKTVSIILPFFNEAEGIPFFFERLDNVISNIPDCRFELICINDGSRDMTLTALETAKKLYPPPQLPSSTSPVILAKRRH